MDVSEKLLIEKSHKARFRPFSTHHQMQILVVGFLFCLVLVIALLSKMCGSWEWFSGSLSFSVKGTGVASSLCAEPLHMYCPAVMDTPAGYGIPT